MKTQAPSPTGPATVPLKTSPVPGASASALPQATVQLESTQKLGAPTAPTMSTIGTIRTDDDDDEPSDTIPTVLSILAFVLSLAVLVLALMQWMLDEKLIGDIFS